MCYFDFKSSYLKIELKMNAKYKVHAGLESKIDSSPTIKRSGYNMYSKGPL